MKLPTYQPRARLADGIVGIIILMMLAILVNQRTLEGKNAREEMTISLLVVIVILIVILFLMYLARNSTSGRCRSFLGSPANYRIYSERFPTYRFVDLFNSIDRLAHSSKEAYWLPFACIAYGEDLLKIISIPSMKSPRPSPQLQVCVGYQKSSFYSEECFWLIRGPLEEFKDMLVIIRLQNRNNSVFLELAATDEKKAQKLLKFFEKDSLAHSIFRGQFLEVSYFGTPHPDYESQHWSNEMVVTFKENPNLTLEDIIFDPKIHGILKRNLFDFFAHREQLHALGIPRKRALLFYGPPGTGKTHTCRYIHSKMEGVTSIVVAGTSLTRLADVTRFARQLQPTLMIVEDVDLVFASREINPYGSSLGDLMDQLDGFAPDEEVMFILTTNAIDRVEAAIRDRPGRINQLLHFGMPTPDLRRRYLDHYLERFDHQEVDMDHIVHQTEMTSQAFLKEYVLRAVQIAAEAEGFQPKQSISLKTEYFNTAFDEITSHGDPLGHSIMGFKPGRNGSR